MQMVQPPMDSKVAGLVKVRVPSSFIGKQLVATVWGSYAMVLS